MDTALTQWKSLGHTFSYRSHERADEARSIFYRRDGRGPTVLALHGFPLSSWDFSRVWPKLSEAHDVIAPDMVGFGFSSKPVDGEYSLASMADSVEALVTSLGVTDVHVVGFDLGTAVAQELLARSEEGRAKVRLRSVCFLNGSLFPEVYRPRWIQKVLVSPLGPWVGPRLPRKLVQKALVSTFGPHTKPGDDDLERFSQLIEESEGLSITHKLNKLVFDRRAHRDRWVSAMQKTRVPLRLVNGPADPNSGAHMMQRYRELIPSPDVVSVGEAIGHWPLFEAPDESSRAILEHWARAK